MLRLSAFLILATLSLQATAGNFDYLPAAPVGPQKDFRASLESGDYRRALIAWPEAYGNSPFAQTQNGVATWSYLLLKNDLPFLALQNVLSHTQPEKLDPRLLKLWATEIKNSESVQRGWIPTRGGWKNIVNNDAVNLRISKKTDIYAAFLRASKVPADQANEKARILWQIVTLAPLINDVDSSLRALKLVRESGQTIIGQDLIAMTQGRVLYQKGDLDGALDAFMQIPKSSSLWVEGVEERAWTHLRQDNYDKAMGDMTTAMSPVLSGLAGPEIFFLGNLMAYKVCDYTRLFNNSETFKVRHRFRMNEMQDLANKGTNSSIEQAFDRFDQRGVSQEAAGVLIASVPRQLFRDRIFLSDFDSRREILREIGKAGDMASADAGLNQLLASARKQADHLRQDGAQRARLMATQDVKEYRMVLNKMHILEGEVIQRLHMDDNLKGQRSKLSKNDDPDNTLTFPYNKNSQEVWMDELDNYKARVKDCPTLKGASL